MKASSLYFELEGPNSGFVISEIRAKLRELIKESEYEVDLITLETGFVNEYSTRTQ